MMIKSSRNILLSARSTKRLFVLNERRWVHDGIQLNSLKPAWGARRPEKRVGRGPGSGHGKTCGRGHKGTKQRSGGSVRPGFEGGQTPLTKRLPKFGFTNAKFRIDFDVINVSTIQNFIDMGRLSVPKPDQVGQRVITMRDLIVAGLVRPQVRHGVKLLAKKGFHTQITTPIHIEVSDASPAAIELIEKAGGTVTCAHYTRLALRALLKPQKFINRIYPRRARPPPKLMARYLDYSRRGEYSPQVQMRNRDLRLYKFGPIPAMPLLPMPPPPDSFDTMTSPSQKDAGAA
mmetsp:Transcript_19249/g.24987  ORF Transcript_19249/g.24987 Transcript_19249/m.24987 type:complete len:289 (-) Transcript_19249:174-1040(-)